jgi:hypothetical protein
MLLPTVVSNSFFVMAVVLPTMLVGLCLLAGQSTILYVVFEKRRQVDSSAQPAEKESTGDIALTQTHHVKDHLR